MAAREEESPVVAAFYSLYSLWTSLYHTHFGFFMMKLKKKEMVCDTSYISLL
jgi:hypothetical protein